MKRFEKLKPWFFTTLWNFYNRNPKTATSSRSSTSEVKKYLPQKCTNRFSDTVFGFQNLKNGFHEPFFILISGELPGVHPFFGVEDRVFNPKNSFTHLKNPDFPYQNDFLSKSL